MLHVTLSGNSALTGGAVDNGGVVTSMSGSLIDGDCAGSAIGSTGYNVESPGDSCGLGAPSDLVDVPVQSLALGPLRDNGGPTETHALMTASDALDRIDPTTCEVDTDQRGEPRPGGSMCDAGAFELQP